MLNKRALVVDDSRSARVVLTRALESLGLIVDAVESAELALDYLQSDRVDTKPDVIFMDYLLTGMDGIAAVRIIKANPRTANIPVFMYTSQNEDSFVHSARLAGAMGILPKTFKPHDVANVLQQARFAAGSAAIPSQVPSTTQFTRSQQIAVVILGAAMLFCVLALMYSNHHLQQQLAQSQHKSSASSASSAPSTMTLRSVTTSDPAAGRVVSQDSETVPYGEVPLAGSRLDRLKNMVNTLQSQSFKGTLRVEVFTGDFCLQGDAITGFHIAPADLPIKQCDMLGNPFADVLSVQQRQSAAFTTYLSNFTQSSDVRIQLADGGRQLATAYPAQMPGLKAGEWNLSAARNNRVEFKAMTVQ
ncbi:MAG TPA: response regulator [Steroidobacteraceae bacterium]|jgi:CheY-like chemotaxis protein|nr:response regulator [Steroidobacteraceae bacterium]